MSEQDHISGAKFSAEYMWMLGWPVEVSYAKSIYQSRVFAGFAGFAFYWKFFVIEMSGKAPSQIVRRSFFYIGVR
jgi:hypothetical protein